MSVNGQNSPYVNAAPPINTSGGFGIKTEALTFFQKIKLDHNLEGSPSLSARCGGSSVNKTKALKWDLIACLQGMDCTL